MTKPVFDNIVIWNPSWLRDNPDVGPRPKLKTVKWESWICPKCKTLYEEDEYDFHNRPPLCPDFVTVKCQKSPRWNNPLARKDSA